MTGILVRLFENFDVKLFVTGVLSVTSFLIGDLYTDAVLAVIMLLIFDTCTGVLAAYIEKQVITSKRFGSSVLKSILYLVAISAGHFVDQSIPGQLAQYSTIAFVAVTEFISIIENIGRMGYKTPQKLLNQLKEKAQ